MTDQILIAKMIEDNATRIEELKASLERNANSNSIVSHSWVVVMPLVGCMKYDLEKIAGSRRFKASNPTFAGRADRANRYTKEDAIVLAADTRNGADEYGTAMHWTDAAKAEIENSEKLNETLRAL
jgi:hypothetical protein